jgi:hypothetical protein
MALQDDLKGYWQEVSKGFGSGRHRNHKLATVGGYALICLLTVAWSFSGGGALSNPLGADVSINTVDLSRETWLQLANQSDDTWTGLRLQLNDKYQLSDLDDVGPGESIQVFVRDFAYEYHVPQPKHVGGAHSLTTSPALGATAPADLEPKTLRISTEAGTHKVVFAEESALEETGGKAE